MRFIIINFTGSLIKSYENGTLTHSTGVTFNFLSSHLTCAKAFASENYFRVFI